MIESRAARFCGTDVSDGILRGLVSGQSDKRQLKFDKMVQLNHPGAEALAVLMSAKSKKLLSQGSCKKTPMCQID